MSFKWTLLFWTLLVSGLCMQETYGDKYEFVFCVPATFYTNTPHVLIATSSLSPVNVTVLIHGTDFQENDTVTRSSYAEIPLPGTVYIYGTEVRSDKTVIVRADAEISVHVMVNDGNGGDGFLVFPTHQLGRNHYVLSHTSYYDSSFVCVSTLDQITTINIKSNDEVISPVTLQPYQSYQLVRSYGTDLTGLQVISDNLISVIAGTQCSIISNTHCDAFVEQMPPVRTWGTHVILSPFAHQSNGYIYRVIGTNVSTEVVILNHGTQILSEGQWYEGDVTSNDIVTINADNPIFVMQYVKGDAGILPYWSDPSMILAPSKNMYISGIATFPVFESIYFQYYFIHVIIDCMQLDGLMYDNSSMANWETIKSSDGVVCSVHGNVTADAAHTVSHEDGNTRFMIAVYGLGYISSYAYLADVGNEFDNVDECAFTPCQNSGNCTESVNVNGYTCQCTAGWSGVHCEDTVDECASVPCQNSGNCTDSVIGYTCQCTAD